MLQVVVAIVAVTIVAKLAVCEALTIPARNKCISATQTNTFYIISEETDMLTRYALQLSLVVRLLTV